MARRIWVLAVLGTGLWACNVGSTKAPGNGGTDCEDCTDGPLDAAEDDQGWSAELRDEMHTISVGGEMMPYDWFLALETADGRSIIGEDVLADVGMVANAQQEDNLPIGFGATLSEDGEKHVGHNCFACHTGVVSYAGKSQLIYGGASRGDFFTYLDTIIESMNVLLVNAVVFDRFAGRVLGSEDNALSRSALYTQVQTLVATYNTTFRTTSELVTVEEGFGRTDANGRLLAISSLFLDPTSYPDSVDAPVAYPALWGTPRFSWDHYGAGVRSYLGRNVSQAISNFAPFNPFTGESSVPLGNLRRIHESLTLLKSPKWPEAWLGEIDQERAQRGASIFEAECRSCHVDSGYEGEIDPPVFTTEELGTDPNYIDNVQGATINGAALGLSVNTPLHEYTQHITSKVIETKFEEMGLSEEERGEYTKGRENLWRAPTGYKAIPLDGVWANAPYLHNNSVPTLHDLLLPPSDRPSEFRVSPDNEFDPEKVGIVSSVTGTLLDASVSGNSNLGHDYGTALSDEERQDLVEYLKTL